MINLRHLKEFKANPSLNRKLNRKPSLNSNPEFFGSPNRNRYADPDGKPNPLILTLALIIITTLTLIRSGVSSTARSASLIEHLNSRKPCTVHARNLLCRNFIIMVI